MNLFCNLCLELETAGGDDARLAALQSFFARVSAAEAAWALYFLSGRRLKALLRNSKLKNWAQAFAGISDWLFDECYEAVGDLGETISLILPPPATCSDASLDQIVELKLKALYGASEELQQQQVIDAWQNLDDKQRFLFNKLLTGSFRLSLPAQLLVKAVAGFSSLDMKVISQRLAGDWEPSAMFFSQLCEPDTAGLAAAHPYPFFRAHTLTVPELESLKRSSGAEWLVEWKWDGIRAQLVKRGGIVSIWSSQEELLTERLPELVSEAGGLADGVVLDGEILAWRDADVLPLQALQQRVASSNPTSKLLNQIPVIFMAYDLLEENGCDIRTCPIEFRRKRLADLLSSRNRAGSDAQYEQLRLFAPCQAQLSQALRLSPILSAHDWQELEALRADAGKMKVAGLVLKLKGSAYGVGRQTGDWWKWTLDPLRLDAVLVAAQAGRGKRAGLFTDYTFALWQEGELLSFARANAELSDTEIRQIDAFVRENTLARYGPVRSVKPQLVFELALESIELSQRYKSGVVARSCRVLSWRQDKPAQEADSFTQLRSSILQK